MVKWLLVILALPVLASGSTWYVKAVTGSDAGAGTYDDPFLTLASVSITGSGGLDSVQSGDTVYLSGSFDNEALYPVGGTSANRTVYLAWDGTTQNGYEYLGDSIHGGDQVTGWVHHSGNIYKAEYTCPGNAQVLNGTTKDKTTACVVQGRPGSFDTILDWHSTLGAVDQGSFYHDETYDTFYVWTTYGGDPDDSTIWIGNIVPIAFLTGAQSYVEIKGMYIAHAETMGIDFGMDDHADSVLVDSCLIEYIADVDGHNVGCVGARDNASSTTHGHFNQVQNSTLRYTKCSFDGGSLQTEHYAGAQLYAESAFVFINNVVHRVGNGFESKGSSVDGGLRGNVVAFNHIYDYDYAGVFFAGDGGDTCVGNLIGDGSDGYEWAIFQANTNNTVAYDQLASHFAQNTIYANTKGLAVGDGGRANRAQSDTLHLLRNIIEATSASDAQKWNNAYETSTPYNNIAFADCDSNLFDSDDNYTVQSDATYTTLTSWVTGTSQDSASSEVASISFDSTSATNKWLGYKIASGSWSITYNLHGISRTYDTVGACNYTGNEAAQPDTSGFELHNISLIGTKLGN